MRFRRPAIDMFGNLVVDGGATAPTNTPATTPSAETVEGRRKRLLDLVAHLEQFVFSEKPSPKLVELYLRALGMLAELGSGGGENVEERIEKLFAP